MRPDDVDPPVGARADAEDVREDEDEPRRREATAEAQEAERQREAEVPSADAEGEQSMAATPPETDEKRRGVMRPPEGAGPE